MTPLLGLSGQPAVAFMAVVHDHPPHTLLPDTSFRYRTQLCKDGANCRRAVCFFAHSLPELRSPTHTWVPSAEARALSARGLTIFFEEEMKK